jgi:predicted RNA-binding Zn-ribbon protein involved in translation (DUF1610 family)
MWGKYRGIKLRLLVLLVGWIPFGLILGAALPAMFGSYVPSYALGVVYLLSLAYTFLQYALYPCPNCGASYRAKQLYQQKCPRCGVPINR